MTRRALAATSLLFALPVGGFFYYLHYAGEHSQMALYRRTREDADKVAAHVKARLEANPKYAGNFEFDHHTHNGIDVITLGAIIKSAAIDETAMEKEIEVLARSSGLMRGEELRIWVARAPDEATP